YVAFDQIINNAGCIRYMSGGLVWIADAQSPTRSGITQDGVPSLPAPHCAVTGSDRAQRSADYLPDHGLQRVAQRLLRYLGVSSQDGACLKSGPFTDLRCSRRNYIR